MVKIKRNEKTNSHLERGKKVLGVLGSCQNKIREEVLRYFEFGTGLEEV
jgi:hypothetical protein